MTLRLFSIYPLWLNGDAFQKKAEKVVFKVKGVFMPEIVSLVASDGSKIEFEDKIIAQGSVKDVYFSVDRTHAIGFYRTPQDSVSMERLQNIVGTYRQQIMSGEEGEYWRQVLCWPESLVEWKGLTGVVLPLYPKNFFFRSGKYAGKEKEGKWFTSAKLKNRFLPNSEKGTWLSNIRVCIQFVSAVRKLHSMGLAHSDLSYKNVLADPQTGRAIVIDLDGLVIPGKFPPSVVGTPDFIAPEVMETRSLANDNPDKKLPSIQTDCHALAVLIYMYLLNRHPLRGGKIYNEDPVIDEELQMGREALFIEHTEDKSNRPKVEYLKEYELPQGDVDKVPYTVCGPYLKEMFDRAFIAGLHNPEKRPSAAEWEEALIKTADEMIPCSNSKCLQKWFVYSEDTNLVCPFCNRVYRKKLVNLEFAEKTPDGNQVSSGYRLAVEKGHNLLKRHLEPADWVKSSGDKPLASFLRLFGASFLFNRNAGGMFRIMPDGSRKKMGINSLTRLRDGMVIEIDDNGKTVVITPSVKSHIKKE